MNKQPLILLGCGGFGQEVAAWIIARDMPFSVNGYLDDQHMADHILGPIKRHTPIKDVQYLTCFGEGRSRQLIRKQLEVNGADFATLISPDVMTATPLHMSLNSIFLGACSISSKVTLGNDLLIQGFAVVGHDVEIEDGVTISSHAFVGGWVKLGAHSTIHPHAVILPRIKIGEGAVIGAGSVVIKDVLPYTTVFGSPAKVIAHGKPND